MIRGSYYNGFAPRDGMPLYPSLWQGCIGAWAPCLGPTGLTLRDWSAYRNHGTLTNMDPATDWALSGGAHALNFGGSNRYVVIPNSRINTTRGAIWCRFAINTPSSTFPFLMDAFGNERYGIFHDAANLYFRAGTGQVSVSRTTWGVSNGVMVTAAVTWFASTLIAFINGVQVASGAYSVSGSGIGTGYIGTSSLGSPGGNPGNREFNGVIDEVRFYGIDLNQSAFGLLASRRGIAYDLAPFRMPYSEQVAGFQAAWALRQRLILGGGGGLG